MEITELDAPSTWSETGTWRGRAYATLSLYFRDEGPTCLVRAEFSVGFYFMPWRLGNRLLGWLGIHAVRADLKRAARILSARAAEH
jgi:hypothetical protein